MLVQNLPMAGWTEFLAVGFMNSKSPESLGLRSATALILPE